MWPCSNQSVFTRNKFQRVLCPQRMTKNTQDTAYKWPIFQRRNYLLARQVSLEMNCKSHRPTLSFGTRRSGPRTRQLAPYFTVVPFQIQSLPRGRHRSFTMWLKVEEYQWTWKDLYFVFIMHLKKREHR